MKIAILTESKYVGLTPSNTYEENVLKEDTLLKEALVKNGHQVEIVSWDDASINWSDWDFSVFRTTWDYFDRYPEFSKWFNATKTRTKFINSPEIITENIDKRYLAKLSKRGVNIPETVFVEKGDSRSLEEVCTLLGTDKFVLKPVVSGAARHTYAFNTSEIAKHASIYTKLIAEEAMMVQAFQENIKTKGEVSYMLFGGHFSHAVLKQAKSGDFRVQDDFGGSIAVYQPTNDEVEFAQNAVKALDETPVYARVDVMYDNNNALCLGELEMIEPELWFRLNDTAANQCAKAIDDYIELL